MMKLVDALKASETGLARSHKHGRLAIVTDGKHSVFIGADAPKMGTEVEGCISKVPADYKFAGQIQWTPLEEGAVESNVRDYINRRFS
jgi:hypothetical protein